MINLLPTSLHAAHTSAAPPTRPPSQRQLLPTGWPLQLPCFASPSAMAVPRAPELPAEVLELIFIALGPPAHTSVHPMPVLGAMDRVRAVAGAIRLNPAAQLLPPSPPPCSPPPGAATFLRLRRDRKPAPPAQLRCQLVCKSWRHALDVGRWPLPQLILQASRSGGATASAPAAALWLQRLRPTVQTLHIQLAGEPQKYRAPLLSIDSPAAQAVQAALLAPRPLNVSPCAMLRRGAVQPAVQLQVQLTASVRAALSAVPQLSKGACLWSPTVASHAPPNTPDPAAGAPPPVAGGTRSSHSALPAHHQTAAQPGASRALCSEERWSIWACVGRRCGTASSAAAAPATVTGVPHYHQLLLGMA